MAFVKGPNGLVIDIVDSVASGLVGDGSRGYRYVAEPAEPAEEKPAPKRRGRPPASTKK